MGEGPQTRARACWGGWGGLRVLETHTGPWSSGPLPNMSLLGWVGPWLEEEEKLVGRRGCQCGTGVGRSALPPLTALNNPKGQHSGCRVDWGSCGCWSARQQPPRLLPGEGLFCACSERVPRATGPSQEFLRSLIRSCSGGAPGARRPGSALESQSFPLWASVSLSVLRAV